MRRPSQVLAAVIAGGLAVLGATVFVVVLAPGSEAQTIAATVTLQNTQYNPAAVALPNPGIVRFIHRDGETPHSILGSYEGQTDPASNYDSHPFCSTDKPADCWQQSDTQESYDIDLKSPGTFRYHCRFHTAMTGMITVAGSGGTVPPASSSTTAPKTTTTRKTTDTTVGTLTTTSEVTSTSIDTSTTVQSTTTTLALTTQTTAPGTALGTSGDDDDDEPSAVLYAVGVILLAAVAAALIPAWRRLT